MEMITKETHTLQSNHLAIAYDVYFDVSRETYKAIVQIAHGMIEHKEKYEPLALFLAQNGFVVAINDHRGHGDSINYDVANLAKNDNIKSDSSGFKNGDSANKIYFGEMGEDGFEMALSDMRNLQIALKSRFVAESFVLIGHSMGSLLARRFLQEYEESIDMLILCGTPSPQRFINIGIFFLQFLRILGINNIARHIANKFSLLAFNKKYAKFDNLNNGKNSGTLWINRDINELKKALANKKSYFTFTINSFICLFRGLKCVFSTYPHKVNNPKMPILFISGEDDACGDFGRGALSALKHIQAQGYENAKLILYANARHELFLELNKEEVFSDVLGFIKAYL